MLFPVLTSSTISLHSVWIVICCKFLLIELFSHLLRNESVLWVGSDTKRWPQDWSGVMQGVWALLMDLGREGTHPPIWPEVRPAVS